MMIITHAMAADRKAGMSYRELAAKYKVSKTAMLRAFTRGKVAHVTLAPVERKGRTLTEFKQAYDKDTIIPAKVKAALKMLGVGWEYEVAFARLAGVSLSDLGNYRDQFAGHVVTLRESRRAWSGSTATAKAMREMI
jgi:lambda repressor-like predicted transcriptional regulator